LKISQPARAGLDERGINSCQRSLSHFAAFCSSTPADGRCALFDARQTFAEVREAAFNRDETNLDAAETVYDVVDAPIEIVNRAPVRPCRDKDRQHDGERDLDELTV
jgi:hypothetical protein